MSHPGDLEARLRRIEDELADARARTARQARLARGALAVACLVAAAAVADPSSAFPCNAGRTSSFFCFAPDQPARADSVNHNFEFLARWVESKVGAANPANAESAPTGSGGLVIIGSSTGTQLALDGDELNARNGTAAAALYVQEGASAGDTWLNSSSGRVLVGGNAFNGGAKLGVNGLLSTSSLQVGSGGTSITKVLTGTIGNCSSPGSTGSDGTVNFSTTFSSPPQVFLSVEEVDRTGCTSARTNARTNSGFAWQAWVGGTASTCDCIHWIAIGQ